ncbi:hypothetical protein ABZ929_08025 [Streptomyces physcomitrii]|uniref:hypothetical protein n=1 Tax=Streptomyces physcomitrii TaxID=2724184 RepID=UPI0033C04833
MAEHEADRGEGREPEDGAEQAAPAPDAVPAFDEDAVWAQIVAGYGEEPPDPPGTKPFRSVEDLALLEPPGGEDEDGGTRTAPRTAERGEPGGAAEGTGAADGPEKPDKFSKPPSGQGPADRPLGSSVVFPPAAGPRDHSPPEPGGKEVDDDEGHFVPPEPPPLPDADPTAKFAWLGALGGPLLLLLAVLLGWEMTWWLTALSVGGFLGGIATLVVRMKDGDEDDEDPGRGAVV